MISFSLPHYTLRRYGLASECDKDRDPALFPRGFAAFASPAAERTKPHGKQHGARGRNSARAPVQPVPQRRIRKAYNAPAAAAPLFSYPCPPLLRTATGFFAPRPLFISPTVLPSAPRAARANRRTVCRNKRSFTDRLSSYRFPSSNVGCSGKARRRYNAPPRFSGLNAARKRIFQKVFRLRTATYAL